MSLQSALNTLREERRRVVEARAAVFADADLHACAPGHRRTLLRQMANELVEHDRAIALLDQMSAGVAAPVDAMERHDCVKRLHAAGRVRLSVGTPKVNRKGAIPYGDNQGDAEPRLRPRRTDLSILSSALHGVDQPSPSAARDCDGGSPGPRGGGCGGQSRDGVQVLQQPKEPENGRQVRALDLSQRPGRNPDLDLDLRSAGALS